MSGFNKLVTSYEEAMAGLEDGMTVIAGGFGLCGIPENLIQEIKNKGTKELTVFLITAAPLSMVLAYYCRESRSKK